MSQLTDFLEGKGTDHQSRYIHDIWAFDHRHLEYIHDFIQWIFPLEVKSQYCKSAAVLTREDFDYCQNSALIQENQLKSLDLMLEYYGLYRKGKEIFAQENLNIRDHIWLKRGGHNQLRITRMIRSLALCGNEEVAQSLQRVVIHYGTTIGSVQPKTMEFWQNAFQKYQEK